MEVLHALAAGPNEGGALRAVTPHRSHTFEVARVLRDPVTGDAVLELREVDLDRGPVEGP